MIIVRVFVIGCFVFRCRMCQTPRRYSLVTASSRLRIKLASHRVGSVLCGVERGLRLRFADGRASFFAASWSA